MAGKKAGELRTGSELSVGVPKKNALKNVFKRLNR